MKNGTRRTTLTLPVKALAEADRIARKRKVNLSVVVAEALEKSLAAEAEAKREGERRVQSWEAYGKAFSRLTPEQQEAVSGVFMDEVVEE
ncbi:MAG TPA: hypothetical protein VMR62_12455 [Bryobacteraceae bacterium]|jgi:metal-responsive CopG/Arc/MetJ family transcriptional regulator|nr:hypothetical protein [Bryobacteraceae bacterium]